MEQSSNQWEAFLLEGDQVHLNLDLKSFSSYRITSSHHLFISRYSYPRISTQSQNPEQGFKIHSEECSALYL
jgi:hypothetical protein